MNVSMGGHGLGPLAVTEADSRLGGDASNAGQSDVGKSGLPAVEDGDGVFLADGEEQFEVFAIGECGEDG